MVPSANIPKGAYFWASVDTRWHVYPQRQPVQLVAHNYDGFWCPLPDGQWYRSPVSFVCQRDADMATLAGEWRERDRIPMFVPEVAA